MNTTTVPQHTKEQQAEAMKAYYRLHAAIYDLTRWTFLFGRRKIVRLLAKQNPIPHRIMEIGCGTGFNLRQLGRQFPLTQVIGMDVSAKMLHKARKNTNVFEDRIQLIEQPYSFGDMKFNDKMDVILFSYSLTMINPQWEELIAQAAYDLKPGGLIGVVDFYNSPFQWFKSHMGNNHVRMDGHLNPVLKRHFQTEYEQVSNAYGGVWQYFMYIGRKV
ncbi:MAG: class I SAM-dependent methyltransferase [Saprospiraceae bacterium]|nr:class I SAM-dependent methyltransferase [Saprospiraceae bacterium]MCB9326699.1 class I SAM-dependent methyltransferase [Lewinellaceae bacterium]